jgi:hypothetical protein
MDILDRLAISQWNWSLDLESLASDFRYEARPSMILILFGDL